MTVSIEETILLGQEEKSTDGDVFFSPTPRASCPCHTCCPRTTAEVVSVGKFALGSKNRLTCYGKKPFTLVRVLITAQGKKAWAFIKKMSTLGYHSLLSIRV